MNSINTTHPLTHGLRDLRAPANAAALQTGADSGTLAANDFASVFKTMLAGVNRSQQHATRQAESFDLGQNQDLAGVMIAQQHARLAFQTTLQVRNKMISAYQDIMNMPI
ncbi:MAG TPA: flagellar hook-basal body complex protein FliE [Xanthomonadaceae bacterium]|nr:flagellar hook-basal body complex protein FliE [Xanthomonadaceae bacterium]